MVKAIFFKVDSHGLGMNNASLTGLKNHIIWFPKDKEIQNKMVDDIKKSFSILDNII